jgi:hypothetical protein
MLSSSFLFSHFPAWTVRSTVNHFGGSLGGPIVHNKLFFFFDSEWVRIALPIVTAATVPTLGVLRAAHDNDSPSSRRRS